MSKFIVLLNSNLKEGATIADFFENNKIIHWQYLPDREGWYARVAVEYEEPSDD